MCLENYLNRPHLITLEYMRKVASFAEGEVSFLALQGSKSGNPGLPLTDHQRIQADNKKKAEKAAVAVAAAAPYTGGKGDPKGKGSQSHSGNRPKMRNV